MEYCPARQQMHVNSHANFANNMKCRNTFHSQQQMTDENDISLSFLIPYIQKKFGKFTWGLGNDDPLT